MTENNTSKKTFYINYSDGIDNFRVKGLMSLCADIITKEKPDELYFLINSPGGDVDSGIAFFNFLKALPTKIIMHNIGSIDSIANVIFVAGEERYANPHSSFLFHGVKINNNGPISFNLGQLEEITDRVQISHKKIAGIVCEHSHLEEKEIEKLFLKGETKDTVFALEKGLINDTRVASIPKNAPFVTVNFNN